MPEWITALLFIIGGVGGLLYFAWALTTFTDLFLTNRSIKLFESDLFNAIESSQPNLSKVLIIASTRNVKRSSVYRALQRFLREAITGRNESLRKHQTLIESYLKEMDDSEPFEGMPDEIRLHLDKIKESIPSGKEHLEPLASKIRELLASSERDNKRQKYYTLGGFLIGLLGLIFAVITYAYPSSPGSNGPSTQTSEASRSLSDV